MTATTEAGARRFWMRRVWTLSWPLILSNLTVPLLGAVDTAVMGHLPDPAFLGAVGIGALVFNFLYWGLGFLRMGTMGFAAQAQGRRDADGLRTTLGQAGLMGLVLGLAAIALQTPTLAFALWLLDAEPQVEALIAAYFTVRIWGAPATLINYGILGWLLGLQRPRAALVLQIVVNGVNIALDLLFVVGLGWNIEGVAAATVIAELVGVALGLVFVAQSLRMLGGSWRLITILQPAPMIAMLRVNLNIFVRTLGLLVGWGYFLMRGAALGTEMLAVNAVLVNFLHVAAFALDGFAHAVTVLVGAALGARDRESFRGAVVAAFIWSGGVAVAIAVIYAVAGGLLTSWLTDIPEVRALAAQFMPWIVLSPVVAVAAFTLDGIFIGATRGPEMRNAMIGTLAAAVPAMWWLSTVWGNHGLWLGLMIFYVARGGTLGLYYPRIERAVADG